MKTEIACKLCSICVLLSIAVIAIALVSRKEYDENGKPVTFERAMIEGGYSTMTPFGGPFNKFGKR